MEERLERFAAALAEIPFWLSRPPDRRESGDPESVLLSLAAASLLGRRYRRVVVDEGRYWSRVATDLIARREIPRWADHRRFEAEYEHLGKGAWVELYRILFGRPLRRILAAAKAAAPGPVLELGSGCGWLSLEIARLGRDVVAIDASADEIALARFFDANRHRYGRDLGRPFYGFRQAPPGRQGKITFFAADLNEAVLPEGPFPLAVSWESLHHLQNLGDLSAAVRRVLSPGGLFLVHETIHEELTGSRLRKWLTSGAFLRLLRFLPPGKTGRPIHEFEPGLFEDFERAFPPAEDGGDDVLDSPFEGATGEAMENILAADFEVAARLPGHHVLTEAGGFQVLEDWTRRFGRPPSRRLVRWLFRAVKLVDDLAVRFLAKRPRHVFLALRPKPAPAETAPASFRDRVGRRCGRALGEEEWPSALDRVFRRVVVREDRWAEDLDRYSFETLFKNGVRMSGTWDELLLDGGWYIREGDYRWTNGSGGIHLAVPRGTRGLEVEIMGSPKATPANPQPLVLRGGEGDICRFQVERPGWQVLRAPLETLPEDVGLCRLESPVFNPRQDLGEEDARNLGVALRSIRFLR
ncbi:MAG: methyltransferase domain-containing protein [Candidatus Aminicenantes bacterium]|nr:methyltransferase domain-containing protein [Candidatus Aminicenantes bacterium]